MILEFHRAGRIGEMSFAGLQMKPTKLDRLATEKDRSI
jgi:hypothetical protein